jgi:Ca2+-transporting ATPase
MIGRAARRVTPGPELRHDHAGDNEGLPEGDTAAERRGLTTAQAAASRARNGANTLVEHPRPGLRTRLRRSLGQPLLLLLLAIVLLYAALGQRRDALVVGAVLLVLGGLEAWTKLRAGRAAGALSRLSAPFARVWRDGRLQELPPAELVCGDVIVLAAGSRVPADARLIESEKLLVDESLITGEPLPSDRWASVVAPADPPAQDGGRSRSERGEAPAPPPDAVHAVELDASGPEQVVLKAGTRILRGRAVAEVTAVGTASTLGRVSELVEGASARSPDAPAPQQRELGDLARSLVMAALALCLVVVVVARVRGQPLPDVILDGLTLAFATVPVELPVLVLIVLGVGALRLARYGAILRHLTGLETLAAMTLVCTDKTGTMTENRIVLDAAMTAEQVLDPGAGREPEGLVTKIAKIASERPASQDPRLTDPIDLAVWQATDWDPPEPIVRFGFDSDRRLASALVEVGGELFLGAKGAPEAILIRSVGWRSSREVRPLDAGCRSRAAAAAARLAEHGARVLAVASRSVLEAPAGGPSKLERELVFEGLLAFSDPLRADVPAAVHELQQAGVAVTMVTGDQPATAVSVARPAGLAGPVFHASQTRDWSDQELAVRALRGCIVARAGAEDKLRLVQAAGAAGAVVAVTGDGVNDAPALRAAAIGVAIGRGASDVAREVADLILVDDNFATLVRAAAESRRLLANLRKAVRYYLAVKLALIAVSLAMVIAQRPLPFTPLQIVLTGLCVEIGASIAFVRQPAEVEQMRRRPRGGDTRILDWSLLLHVLAGGITLAAVGGTAFLIALPLLGLEGARTVALGSWLAAQAALGVMLGSQRPVSLHSLVRNPTMLVWASAAVAAAAAFVFVPRAATFVDGAGVPLPAAVAALAGSVLVPSWLDLLARLRRRRGAPAPTAPAHRPARQGPYPRGAAGPPTG